MRKHRANALACVTGRFQPVHAQHVELIEMALLRADQVIIGITNPDTNARAVETTSLHRHTSEANPFSYFERSTLLRAVLRAKGWQDRVMIVPFDLTRPACWPEYAPVEALQVVRIFSDWEREKARQLQQAGYQVWEVTGDPATKLNATDIRAVMAAGQDWARLVPAATVPILSALVAKRTEMASS